MKLNMIVIAGQHQRQTQCTICSGVKHMHASCSSMKADVKNTKHSWCGPGISAASINKLNNLNE